LSRFHRIQREEAAANCRGKLPRQIAVANCRSKDTSRRGPTPQRPITGLDHKKQATENTEKPDGRTLGQGRLGRLTGSNIIIEDNLHGRARWLGDFAAYIHEGTINRKVEEVRRRYLNKRHLFALIRVIR
jgi:hypothetical protein